MTPATPNKKTKKCGMIMPIATHPEIPARSLEGCAFPYWMEAIAETDFEPRLVSDDVAVGLIHEPHCDEHLQRRHPLCATWSSRNPNVMFELGLRLAFDKADDHHQRRENRLSFDTGVIEHLSYPSSLCV